jgi:DNA-binding transcriptional ArsR family regulator
MAEVAALVGDPARANILCALLDGRALTATELAFAAGVSPQTTSGHLGKLLSARLLLLVKQGRHRYYRLAGSHVGQMLESIMNVALAGPPRFQPKSKLDEKLRHARTCYDHIAGLLGVGIAERLAKREFLILGNEAGEVTPAGADFLSKLGVDLSGARAKRRVFCRPCVDWTERRPAHRRCSWRGLGEPVLRTEMDRTVARQSRPHHYAGRPPRADGSLRAFNLTAARLVTGGRRIRLARRSVVDRSDSSHGGKGMLPLRLVQQSYREAMQPREEKVTGPTTADLIRMCRTSSGREIQPSQNGREDHSADHSK